jgi:hypothetical protein
MTALLILGVVVDVLMALFLLVVSGWIIDSWHDPNGAWVGIAATSFWLVAFVLSAGAPILGYVLKRRGSSAGRVAFTVWFPACLLIGICIVGFMISPP